MDSPIEKLIALKERKKKELQKCEAQIQALQHDISELNGLIDGIAVSILELEGDKSDSNNKTPVLIGKYASTDLTPAVLDVVTTLGTAPGGLSATEISEKLKAEGFKTEAKNLYASVYSVAMRLVKGGKIREGVKNGSRSFVRKQA